MGVHIHGNLRENLHLPRSSNTNRTCIKEYQIFYMSSNQVRPSTGAGKTDVESNIAEVDKISRVFDLVKEDPAFGLFSIFRLHPCWCDSNGRNDGDCCCNGMVKIMPLTIFMCQWLCLIALGINQWTDYTRGFCPNSGTLTEKLLMMGISAIYFVRSSLLLRKNYSDTFDNQDKMMTHRAADTVFDFYQRLDWLHQFSHHILSTLFNLWIVFVAKDVMDMVLNSLAIEFLTQLDDEFKTMYFDNYAGLKTRLYELLDKQAETWESCQSKWMKRFDYVFNCLMLLILLASLFVPLVCLTMIFFSPYCK